MAGAPTPAPLTEVEPDIQGARHLDLDQEHAVAAALAPCCFRVFPKPSEKHPQAGKPVEVM